MLILKIDGKTIGILLDFPRVVTMADVEEVCYKLIDEAISRLLLESP
jgi:hypothetical protein